ncbi:hypothetical protein [Sporosarcina limicola]|uniref:Uncharacterized protein n=1 Tax=Sporosarcina limicola TaxID=34101 RepID=A0A927MJV9_9BACL|nr:hypothetical protein [Sporosarcina limicola]MBE1555730.1 hypothetical protein [Sporosarcina limicola]
MSQEPSGLFPKKMKMLIKNGNRYFVMRNKSGATSIQQLANLGLTL